MIEKEEPTTTIPGHGRVPLFNEEGYGAWCKEMSIDKVTIKTKEDAVRTFFFGLAFPDKTFSEIYEALEIKAGGR